MSSTEIVHHGGAMGVEVQREAILRHLGLDPNKAETQALVLVCERYDLDPVLKHMVLIKGTPYITRDGLLHVAHRSGRLDGIELVEQGETPTHWTATVAVHVKGMSRPFAYPGRYPKDGPNKTYGPEMAVKTAEVMALRRAFDVTGIAAAEEAWADQAPAAAPPQRAALEAGDPDTPWAGWDANDWLDWGTRAGVGRPELQTAGGPLRGISSLSVVATAPDHIKRQVYALGGGVP